MKVRFIPKDESKPVIGKVIDYFIDGEMMVEWEKGPLYTLRERVKKYNVIDYVSHEEGE